MTQPPYPEPPPQPHPHQPWAAPPPSSGSGRTIALAVGGVAIVVLLLCAGVITALVVIGRDIGENISDALADWDPERPGGRDNPLTVGEGEGFEIDGIEYQPGWRLELNPRDQHTITGLEGHNDREDGASEYVFLDFAFVTAAGVEVGEVTCSSGATINHGATKLLRCSGYDRIAPGHDRIRVSAR
ncbi:hypothetical protein L615_009000000080 [Nocardioides sp. J9]|uniref:hypothetical protein n=1 Tax=Nocardioides sp. J9 TaxID=935844 RepID=UPI0011A8CC24|nr:hypothetical protein [Nocardioides sp. J9]TWG90446.1 hypothetical protein L615_009000000080 [Nocardioides sp. J9]